VAVIISRENSDGTHKYCDGKCYGAKPTSPCTCICNGANHAIGMRKALANIENGLGKELLKSEDGISFPWHEANRDIL
jgi:hypothetical protein